MSSSPSDEWLLALLDEKSPEELTPAELAALRERAHVSPAIRQAIAEHLRLDAALHARFGAPNVTAEAILRRAAPRRGRFIGFGLFAILFAAAVGTVLWLRDRDEIRPAHNPADRSVATRETPPRRADAGPSVASPRIAPVEAPRPSSELVATEESAPVAPAIPAPPAGPWAAALADDARIVPFEESAFAPFDETFPGFEVADEFPASTLAAWLSPVPNQPFNINEGQWRGKRFAGLEGLGRLSAPWRPDAVLRLAAFDVGEFSLHLWHGQDGYLLRFYPHARPQLLAAYAVTRDGADPLPKTFRLVATDGGAYSRANAGAVEIRHQDERLVVTRGAVPLLVLPFPKPPAELFLEGRTRIRTLAMHRGESAPLPPAPPRRELLAEGSPDALSWITSADPPARLTKADGKVTLSIDGSAPQGARRVAWAAVRLPEGTETGLAEAVFRLDDLSPGTGLYLGDAEGRPIHTLFASENTPAGRPLLSYGWTNRDGTVPEPRWRWDADPRHELAPTAGPGSWVKLLVTPGGLKTYVSGDGEHWGPAAKSPERAVRGDFASIGLFAIADGQPRTASASLVSVRELSGLVNVADAAVRQRVPAFAEPLSSRPADWLTWVMATRPGDVPLETWLRACGVESLARGLPDPVAFVVLDGLIREAIDSDRPARDVVALLHDAALLSDLWDDRARRFAEHYETLARRIVEQGSDPKDLATKLTTVAEGYLAAPIWTETRPWALPPAVVRDIVAVAPWSPNNAPAARRVAAYLAPGHPESGWATDEEIGLARLAVWGANQGTGSTFDGSSRFGWRHPLATEPGREGTTVAAELESALAAGAYDDAARSIATLSELADLVPAAGDPNRFVPPAGLVAEAAARHPDLVKTLSERFGSVGLLRVRQAAADGDDATLQDAAIRYFGTTAASEAHRHLGESALADGRFGEASSHFASALATSLPEDRPNLTARRRLAAALAGEEVGEPASGSVTFGSRSLDPAAFEQLIGELQRSRTVASVETSAASVAIPEASVIKAEARGRFEGDLGRNPGRSEFRRFDWAGRQIGVAVSNGVAYLTNRFQVVAFSLEHRLPYWTVGSGGEQGEAHAFPNVAFTPVPRGDRLYVRRLVGRAPELACLATTAGGKPVWRSAAGLAFASDPLFDAGSLVAVTYSIDGRAGGPYSLSLARLSPDDGAVTASVPLLTLNGTGDDKPYATLTSTPDGFVVSTWGTVVRCEADGTLAWIRKLPYLPAASDPDSDRFVPDPPLVDGERILLASPGSRAVICLETLTGRLLWSRPLGELERFSGRAGAVAVIRSGDSLLGLDPRTGETAWIFRRNGLLDGLLCDENTLLATARTPLENRQDALSLMRIDAASGLLKSEQVIRVEREEELLCGPLFLADGTVWGLLGQSTRDAQRTLVEFASDSSAKKPGPAAVPGPLAAWTAAIERQTVLNAAVVLPGWTVVAAQTNNPERGAEFRAEAGGERSVLVTEANADRAARFVRTIEVPTGPSKLITRVGREDDRGWTLRLLADGKPFASELIDAQTAPDGWRTVTFDLSPLAGRNVTLALDQGPSPDKPEKGTKALWGGVSLE